MRTTTIFAETHTSERANHVAYRLVSLLLSWCQWFCQQSLHQKQVKKMVTFFITFTNVFFIFRIKNAFLTFFYFFPNVYYNYMSTNNKKAQVTQGLRATAPSFQDGGCSKMAVIRHLGYHRTGNSAIRSGHPENPCLEPDMEWIGCTVKLYCDLEIGVGGHSRSLKVAPWDRPIQKTSY